MHSFCFSWHIEIRIFLVVLRKIFRKSNFSALRKYMASVHWDSKMEQMRCWMILMFFTRSTMFSICLWKRCFKSKFNGKCTLILFIDVIGKCLHLAAWDIPAGTEYNLLQNFLYFYLYLVLNSINIAFQAVWARLGRIGFTSEIWLCEITLWWIRKIQFIFLKKEMNKI